MISPALIYDPTAEQVARALISAGAYRIRFGSSEEQFFTWKSGIRAPVYTDCRVLNGDPGARGIVMRALGSSIKSNFPDAEYVVGIAEAGIVWSTIAAIEVGLPHAFVRKSIKPHGIPARVDCSPPPNVKAVLVDDLVASGESLMKAVKALREERNIATIGVQSIVNWDFLEMRSLFADSKIRIRALVSYPQLLDAALETSLLSQSAYNELALFYRNPRHHNWNLTAFSDDFQAALNA